MGRIRIKTEVDDSHYLDMLAHWIETMHRQGRFNSNNCEHADKAVAEMTEKIRAISAKIARLERNIGF